MGCSQNFESVCQYMGANADSIGLVPNSSRQALSTNCHAEREGTGQECTFMSVDAVAIRLGTPGLKDIAQVAASCAESLNRGAEPGPDLAS